ncbi:MAG: 50S ribosomal protein L5 [Nanoarchaeota archaeon]|nr:50S ribosomal protein L5 [Nanoarchaeota archaeon]
MNAMQKIKIEKITLNVGAGTNQDTLKKGMQLIKNLTGKEPVKTVTKKRLPGWGLRPGLPIGCKLTLRGEEAQKILVRLVEAKDKKMKPSYFGENGVISFGIHEYIDVPDLSYSPEIGMMGFEVCINIARPGERVSKRKLRKAKIHKKHRLTKQDAIDFFKTEFNVTVEEK